MAAFKPSTSYSFPVIPKRGDSLVWVIKKNGVCITKLWKCNLNAYVDFGQETIYQSFIGT